MFLPFSSLVVVLFLCLLLGFSPIPFSYYVCLLLQIANDGRTLRPPSPLPPRFPSFRSFESLFDRFVPRLLRRTKGMVIPPLLSTSMVFFERLLPKALKICPPAPFFILPSSFSAGKIPPSPIFYAVEPLPRTISYLFSLEVRNEHFGQHDSLADLYEKRPLVPPLGFF